MDHKQSELKADHFDCELLMLFEFAINVPEYTLGLRTLFRL